MLKHALRFIPVLALALTAALPSAASAAGGGGGGTGMTMTIGRPTMAGRVLVNVPVTITCAAPLAGQPLGFGFINVSIEQSFGKSVSHGSGGASFSVCPASPQTIVVQVTPDLFTTPPSGSFHGGTAIVSASAGASDPSFTIFEGGTAGPQAVKL